MKGWGWVLLGGIFEVGFTTCLKLQQSDPRWGVAFLVCAVLSFECLAQGIKQLSVGLAYAVWTGIGAVGAFALGILAFGDSAAPLRIAVVCALVAALVGLKLLSDGSPASQLAPAPRPAAR